MKLRSLLSSLPLFSFLVYFMSSDLMGYDTGECPMFGTVFYDLPCRAFSIAMFLVGLLIMSLYLSGKLRLSYLLASAYFGLSFLEAWEWVLEVKIIALSTLFFSILLLFASPREVETGRSFRNALSLVFYSVLFFLFSISALSYALFFRWACDEAYSGALSLACSILSLPTIALGFSSPYLWAKGKKLYAALALLPPIFFMQLTLKLLAFPWLMLFLAFILPINILGEDTHSPQRNRISLLLKFVLSFLLLYHVVIVLSVISFLLSPLQAAVYLFSALLAFYGVSTIFSKERLGAIVSILCFVVTFISDLSVGFESWYPLLGIVLSLAVLLLGGGGMNEGSGLSWFPLILLFRLAFRFITLLDPILGMVFFYNSPLFVHLPRFLIITYPFLMGALEAYLIWPLRRGTFPVRLLFGYFSLATIFEFPYALVKSGYVGLLLLALPWYITAPSGLLLVLTSSRRGKPLNH